jgi:hypothetical protein
MGDVVVEWGVRVPRRKSRERDELLIRAKRACSEAEAARRELRATANWVVAVQLAWLQMSPAERLLSQRDACYNSN